MELYLNLFYLTCIVTLVNYSGFFESVDEWINKRLKFYHLPKLFFCAYCQSFWLTTFYCVFYTLKMGIEWEIWMVLISLILASLTEIISPLYKLIIELIKKIIYQISKIL